VQREENPLYHRATILLKRLERLSADSIWAHRASGLRGSLIRAMTKDESFTEGPAFSHFNDLVSQGYEILNNAAREIPEFDNEN
jgi:hypothetical protein